MRFGALAILAVLAASPALAQPAAASDAAAQAFEKVCLPASERSQAAGALALAAGYVRDPEAPAGLVEVFPLAGISPSFTVPATAGEVHLVSTVMPPPATPFNCLVSVSGDVATLFPTLGARLTAAGYVANPRAAEPGAEFLDYQKAGAAGSDRVMGLRNLSGRNDIGDVLLIAYHVGG